MSFKRAIAAMSVAGLMLGGASVALAEQTPLADQTEVADLKMMFEEERMAHDLYVALGEKWGSRKFDNISRAETKHNNLVGQQLDRLGIEKPSASEPGKYQDPAIQQLYDGWLEQGLNSQADAFRVGAELERRDIADLEKAIAATDDPAVKEVYERLLAGSKNHLAAFEKGGNGKAGKGRMGNKERACPMREDRA